MESESLVLNEEEEEDEIRAVSSSSRAALVRGSEVCRLSVCVYLLLQE